ncbi:MAG TPA: Asp-tRNA(Asn)/Glu-tRNA(Gln) amidotransferase subunit GatC [Dehalococcoidales bacterium]|nr:Asp-tRNA(Asn)/Glu-tRNA(Gln) amidotransferase subunit GatC [Dehalococcoidales bacterium]
MSTEIRRHCERINAGVIIQSTFIERSVMRLSREEVIHIAQLARLGMTEADIEKAREQLSHILENFEVLKEVDTTDIPPTAQSINLRNVIREDVPSASLTQEQVLANAPDREEDFIKLRAVLDTDNG